MRAYNDGEEIHGEKIDASGFRECFRIVTQAVKGLGLPSDQKKPAQQAILEQAAAAIKSTQETVSLATNPKEGEVKH